MNLTQAKRLFFKLRKEGRVDVCEKHVISDHLERGYTIHEVINLVMTVYGHFEDTSDLRYKGERFYWRTEDVFENRVRLVIEFDEDEDGQLILVVSAGDRS